jgi:hypothetical protein
LATGVSSDAAVGLSPIGGAFERGRQGMTEIYRAGWQLTKVRFVMVLALACAIGGCWWGWDIFQTYGIRPADGGVLAPFGTRLAFGGGVALLGLAFLVGMWFYGKLYVGSARYDQAHNLVHLRTIELIFGGRDLAFPPSAVEGADWHEGKNYSYRLPVDAPWFSIRIAGRRWPLILDAQGRFPDPALIARLLKLG